MARLTDEELSRVLTAHELGGLGVGGARGPAYPCCVVQAARESICGKYPHRFERDQPIADLRKLADWFDDYYKSSWTADEFLAQLVGRGFA